MGKGMRAGKTSKETKDRRKLERLVNLYADQAEKRLVRTARENLAEEVKKELTYRHNVDMIAVMFALRDEFSFGKSRIIRAMKKSMDHAERMLLDHADIDDLLAVLEDETGIREEELIWDVELEIEDEPCT